MSGNRDVEKMFEDMLRAAFPHLEWNVMRRVDVDKFDISARYDRSVATTEIRGLDLAHAKDRNQIMGLMATVAADIERTFVNALGENYRPSRNQRQTPPGSSPQGVHPGENSGVREAGRTLMELIESG